MKPTSNRFLAAFALLVFMFYGCNKAADYENQIIPQNGDTTTFTSHVYGVLPTTDEMVKDLLVFSKESIPISKQLEALPVSLKLTTPAVRDQGQIGSCTAFCGAETDEMLYYYNKGYWSQVLSPAFLYYCERVLILKQKITADNGAYMVNIPQALQKYGDCLETSYPYPVSNKSTAYKTPPTSAAMTEGLVYKIGSNYGLVATGDVTAVKTLLSGNTPVMMGFNVYDNSSYTLFEGLNSASNCTYNPLTTSGALLPGARLLGGHATPIVGWDDSQAGGKGAFLVMNSWGTSWGN